MSKPRDIGICEGPLCANSRHSQRRLFFTQKRTSLTRGAVSALCQEATGRYLVIRQPNSTTAAPITAAMTDVTIPPSASSMAM